MENVYNYILNELNISYGDSIVVAVSGGPDSSYINYYKKDLRY